MALNSLMNSYLNLSIMSNQLVLDVWHLPGFALLRHGQYVFRDKTVKIIQHACSIIHV